MKKRLQYFGLSFFVLVPGFLFSQNVGVGITSPSKAKLQIEGMVGNSMLVARGDATSSGISLSNVSTYYPTLGFNTEISSNYRRMHNGRASFFQFNSLNGDNAYYTSSDSLAPGASIGGYFRPMILQGNGNTRFDNYLGIGIDGHQDSGKVTISHNSTISSPTLKLLEDNSGDFARLELANTSTNRFWHIAGYNSPTTASGDLLNFYHNVAGDVISINGNGQVAIGTPIKFTVDNSYKLAINGKAICTELKVQVAAAWPDYVFAKKYKLRSLPDLEAYIAENQHLPNIPTAAEVKNSGISIGDMQQRLMEKVEELTLYIIEQNKKITAQNKRIQKLEKRK